MNPGQNHNNWICISLEGESANKAAIGSKIKLTFTDNGVKRSVHREVSSGGSFGASPLRKEIGLGKATKIDEIVITWQGGNNRAQVFKDVSVNQFIRIKEWQPQIEKVQLKKLKFPYIDPFCKVPAQKVSYNGK